MLKVDALMIPMIVTKWPFTLNMTLRSKFSITEQIICKDTSFCQVFNIGFIRCVGKCFSPTTDDNFVEYFILYNIILFNFNFILFYFVSFYNFIIPMMVWVNALYEVLCCNWPHCVLADGTANFTVYLFVLLWLMLLSLGQVLLSPYYLLSLWFMMLM